MAVISNINTNSFEAENLAGTSIADFYSSIFGVRITNNSDITAPTTAISDDVIELTNTLYGTLATADGNPLAIDQLVSGAQIFFNDRIISGNARLVRGRMVFTPTGIVCTP